MPLTRINVTCISSSSGTLALVKKNCLSMREKGKYLLEKSLFLSVPPESLRWLVKGFIGEYEHAPMNPTKILERISR